LLFNFPAGERLVRDVLKWLWFGCSRYEKKEYVFMAIRRALGMVYRLIPDLDRRTGQFETGPLDIDDELIGVFHEELKRLTENLENGLAVPDLETVRAAAHSIKGMCGAVGLPEISVLAQEIEETLRRGEMERCAALCAALINWARDPSAGPA
jgi:HPt (histidine-containing phosphotransfer) domain-containing protein